MKTNVIRICLDAAMAVLLILMYKKTAISINFHEIFGLVVFGLFVIHNLLNRRWIVAISRRMFGGKLAPRTRIGYVVDVLLLIWVTCIAVSGIMISQTILTGIYGNRVPWTLMHYFAAACALLLLGVHIGLHWSFIRTTFAKVLRLPRVVARPLGVVLLAAILVYGGYSVATTSFTGWLSAPFTYLTTGDVVLSGSGGGRGGGMGLHGSVAIPGGVPGVIAAYGSIVAIPAVLTVLVEAAAKKRRRRKPAGQPA